MHQCKNRHGSLQGRHPRLPHVHRVAAALGNAPLRDLGLGDRGVRRRGGAGLDLVAVRPAEQALGAAQRVARPLLARLQVEHAAAVGRARVGAPRRNAGAGLLRRARRRAQPLVVEHDVERARPQRRRRHALRARPPLRLLPLGDAAQRFSTFNEAPEQGRRPRPLRPPLRRVALRRRPPRLGACPAVRPPQHPRLLSRLPPHSRTRCARARRCTSRAPTALPSVGERRNLF